jgi:hypothetical protein
MHGLSSIDSWQTFGEDELSRSHSTYQWIFQASRNWSSLRDLIPAMRVYIETDPVARNYRPANMMPPILPDDTPNNTFSFAPIFKQLFCIAAQQLANLTHGPLEKLGVLFEEPLETGTVPIFAPPKIDIRPRSAKGPKTTGDTESGTTETPTVARGKYFFLHRQISKSEAARFAALGYRFANIGQIAEPLAKSMQVNREVLAPRLERMKLSAAPEHLLPPGTHLACFMVRPSMYKSFDVLVSAAAQNQLPFVTMQAGDLTEDQCTQLRRFDDLTVSEILRVLLNQANESQVGEEIRWQLYNIFVKLVDILGDYDTMMTAKFSAKAFRVACRNPSNLTPAPTCTLLSVRVLRSIHAASFKKDLTYVPLSFFSAQQQVQGDQKDDDFERRLRHEFRDLLPGGSKDATSVSVTNGRASSTWSGTESPRATGFSKLGRFMPSRRSDEATFVEREREKSIDDASDIELTETSDSHHERQFTPSDIAKLKCPGSNWVGEVFLLFGLGAQGWATVPRNSGWKWDISVENAFEVGIKDRQSGMTTQDTRPFDAV